MIYKFSVEIQGQEREVTVEALDGDRWRVTHDGRSRVLEARQLAGGDVTRTTTWSMLPEGGGQATLVDVDGAAPDLTVTLNNVSIPLKLVDARRKLAQAAVGTRAQATGPAAVKSPMPGKVVKVLVKPGDEVKSGQGVVVVEAMKMENELKTPRDGKIKDVKVSEGQAVESGQTLATVE